MTSKIIITDSINLAIFLTGYLVCLFCVLQIAIASRIDVQRRAALYRIFLCLFVFDAANMAGQLFEGRPGAGCHIALTISNFMEFLSASMLIYFVFKLIRIHIGSEKRDEVLFKATKILMYIQAALITANLFTGDIYEISSSNIYERSSLYPISYVIPTIMSFICFSYRVKDKDHLTQKQKIVFDLCIAVMLVLETVQLLHHGVMLLVMAASICSMLLYILILEDQREQFESQLEENMLLRTRILTGQVEPHFLSNTLIMIRTMCEPGSDSFRAISNLSEFIKAGLRVLTDTEPIPIEEELEIVERYLELQNRRFEGKMVSEWNIEDEEFTVPAFSVQIPTENAIKHGFRHGNVEYGKIVYSTYETEKFHVVSIKDNGAGFDTGEVTKGTGLENVEKRVSAMCSGSVDVESIPGLGTEVKIYIPKRGNNIEDFDSRRRENGAR